MSTELAMSGAVLMPLLDTQAILERQKSVREYLAAILAEGVDYAEIPGTRRSDKEAPRRELLQPGAEKVCTAFGLVARFEVVTSDVDHTWETTIAQVRWLDAAAPADKAEQERRKAAGKGRWQRRAGAYQWQESIDDTFVSRGLYRYVVRCELWRESMMMGEALGVCSSLETKYARTPRDAEHTILSMARKRAFVSAVRTVVGLSGQFTSGLVDEVKSEQPRASEEQPDSPMALDPAEVERENARQKQVLDWFKEQGATKASMDAVKAAATARTPALLPYQLIDEAREAGCTNLADVLAYVETGEVPQAPAAQAAPADPVMAAQAPLNVDDVLTGGDVLHHHGVNQQDCEGLAAELGIGVLDLATAAKNVADLYPGEWRDMDSATFEAHLRTQAEALKAGVKGKRGGK